MRSRFFVVGSRESPSSGLRRLICIWTLAALTVWCSAFPDVAHSDEDHERFFETHIRPILSEHCIQCHGPNEQSAELRLDTRAHVLKGGESGQVITPGKPDTSRLVKAVRRSDDLAMPPDEELTPQQVRALVHWVELGAPWPESSVPLVETATDASRSHWAFEPVRKIEPPVAGNSDRGRNPIDVFVFNRLQESELSISPAADPRTLIRRVTYGLTGLPPSTDDVDRFVDNPGDEAWQELVERLLESPAYGEKWARHWLDIARYSDTKGYVYAREERRWVHAWSYRDWVIEALNEDMPYDRFLLLQLAADQVPDRAPNDLAAMGFLTIGRRFLGVTRDIMDDRIDAITRGTMGLTVACARCHDHKYDPIPTADYYSLYGILHSCEEQLVELPGAQAAAEEWQQEYAKRQQKFDSEYESARRTAADRVRGKVLDYLIAQTRLDALPAEGFDQILLEDDVIPGFIRRWDAWLCRARRAKAPAFVHWHAFAELPTDGFSTAAPLVLQQLSALPKDRVNSRIAAVFAQPPTSFFEVIECYATELNAVRDEWESACRDALARDQSIPARLRDDAAEQLRQVLYGPDSPSEVPDESMVHTELLFDNVTCTKLWQLQGEIDRWINQAKHEPRYALTLADRKIPTDQRVYRRGNPMTPGDNVPRQFLALLSAEQRRPFRNGSGRLELAQSIIDPANPLTARVIVNRVWARHFGRGLVATPSDFGMRAGAPSHPDLLDWLTHDFIEHEWSLKHLHRRILLSATYRQSSLDPADTDVLRRARLQDSSNRLLWRMAFHRLTFEEFRDSILTVSGELDPRPGGRPGPLFGEAPSVRRTIYGEVDRQFFPAALRAFDVANPDIHIPQRSETTVPQQALFYMNHPLVQDRARKLAAVTADSGSPQDRIQRLFRRVLQRSAQAHEVQNALTLVEQAKLTTATPAPLTIQDWSYFYGNYEEEKSAVVDVRELPHFTGEAWQGGPKWPDPKLGWVQLTAAGGHPGNDREHAAIRRWIAPRDMTIEIASILRHEAQPGDGVRAFIVSSRAGQLAAATIHHQTVELNADRLSVNAGDTIDFVVHIGETLNSDQFLWEVTINDSGDESGDGVWNSKADFAGKVPSPLQPWEQLAQVLLCCNEFLFVD